LNTDLNQAGFARLDSVGSVSARVAPGSLHPNVSAVVWYKTGAVSAIDAQGAMMINTAAGTMPETNLRAVEVKLFR
jgi:hypothetical protein